MSKNRRFRPYEELCNYALGLRNGGNYGGAISELESLRDQHPEDWVIHFLLGICLFELERNAEAIVPFQMATKLNPKNEKASVGLFHCLFDVGRVEDAISEMERFLDLSDSEVYREIKLAFEKYGDA